MDPLRLPRGVSWPDTFLQTARSVARAADRLVPRLRESSADTVVNVHRHAWPAYEAFVRRHYAEPRPRIVCLSMNPARNGAVQSGIAFTDAPTARELVPDFDQLVERPARLSTDRPEMSGRHLRGWAERHLGGLAGLYEQALFPIACPVAVLRGPKLLNVPLPALRGSARRAADAFYETHAPRLVRAAQPRALLFLGDYAAQRWRRLAAHHPDLRDVPVVVTHNPAARISNRSKWAGWSRAWVRAGGALPTLARAPPQAPSPPPSPWILPRSPTGAAATPR
jgi:hypothetical protein